MEPNEQDARLQHHEEILRGLVAMLAAQHEKNQSYDALIQEQREFNRQQVAINADIKTTLARIETLLARVIPQSENGREA